MHRPPYRILGLAGRLLTVGAAIRQMFAALEGQIYGAHSKGVALEDRLIIHLSETVTGAPDDRLDHATFLHCLAALPGAPCLVLEHLPPEAIPGARDYLRSLATMLGLELT
jgi:hypothetical protein